jgi:hypothetical protein
VAAIALEGSMNVQGVSTLTAGVFPPVFLLIGAIAAASTLIFMRLPRDVGHELLAPAPEIVSRPDILVSDAVPEPVKIVAGNRPVAPVSQDAMGAR